MAWIEADNGNAYNLDTIAGVERSTKGGKYGVRIVLGADAATHNIAMFDEEAERDAYFDAVKASLNTSPITKPQSKPKPKATPPNKKTTTKTADETTDDENADDGE